MIAAQGVEPRAADQQLSELARHELILAIGDADDEFSHDLIQQAAYSRIADNGARARLAIALRRVLVLATSGQPLVPLRPDASAIVKAIEALARQRSGDDTEDFGTAIEPLRLADDKSRLACVLNLAASIELERQRFDAASAAAEEALARAESIGEANESVLAQATLAQAALALGDSERAGSALDELRPALEAPGMFSAGAAKAALAALAAMATMAAMAAMAGTDAVRAAGPRLAN